MCCVGVEEMGPCVGVEEMGSCVGVEEMGSCDGVEDMASCVGLLAVALPVYPYVPEAPGFVARQICGRQLCCRTLGAEKD